MGGKINGNNIKHITQRTYSKNGQIAFIDVNLCFKTPGEAESNLQTCKVRRASDGFLGMYTRPRDRGVVVNRDLLSNYGYGLPRFATANKMPKNVKVHSAQQLWMTYL